MWYKVFIAILEYKIWLPLISILLAFIAYFNLISTNSFITFLTFLLAINLSYYIKGGRKSYGTTPSLRETTED